MSGVFDVYDTIELKGKNKSVIVTEGTYITKLKIKKDEIKMKIVVDGDEKKIKFKLKDGQRVPTGTTNFSFTASEVGQLYDVEGEIKTEVTYSETYSGTESCHSAPRPCTFRPGGGVYCPPSFPEYRSVTYRDKTVSRELSFELVSESQVPLAKFSGDDLSTSRDVVYRGMCY